jgi:hypothetical protein
MNRTRQNQTDGPTLRARTTPGRAELGHLGATKVGYAKEQPASAYIPLLVLCCIQSGD